MKGVGIELVAYVALAVSTSVWMLWDASRRQGGVRMAVPMVAFNAAVVVGLVVAAVMS